ncbi:MAG: hypothetical protein ACREVD_10570 [Burkholderiales bacterium]
MTPNLVNVSGLVFDLVGAWLVVAAIAFAKSEIIEAQTYTVPFGNPALELALRLQRHDAVFGLMFLALGFFLQILAALGVSASPVYWAIPAGYLVVGLGFHLLMRRHIKKSRAQLVQQMIDESK